MSRQQSWGDRFFSLHVKKKPTQNIQPLYMYIEKFVYASKHSILNMKIKQEKLLYIYS